MLGELCTVSFASSRNCGNEGQAPDNMHVSLVVYLIIPLTSLL